MCYVYILFSERLNKHYVGSTNDLIDRLKRHNSGEGEYTRKGIPWTLVTGFECTTRSEEFNLKGK